MLPGGEDAMQGYSLSDEWLRAWHRVYDREGRPDPSGPIQQRFGGSPYPEYPLDLAVGRYPMADELAWSESESAARMWIHSLDERTLVNNVQLKNRATMGGAWSLGLRFDRMDTKEHSSGLFAVEFERERIAESYLYSSILVYPRLEKEDVDAVFSLGVRGASFGDLALRVMSFDTFVNASHALIRAREGVVDEHLHQKDPPLGFSLEYLSPLNRSVRGEIYVGWIVPAETEHEFPGNGSMDHIRGRQGLFVAGLAEWAVLGPKLQIGAYSMLRRTLMQWRYLVESTKDQETLESSLNVELYALSQARHDLDIEARIAWLSQPEENVWFNRAELNSQREDRQWAWSLRGIWMMGKRVGLDTGLLGISRTKTGPPMDYVDGFNQRWVTRCVLSTGDVWVSFGVSWDLEPGWSVYDGGGMTMLVDF